jgi:ABC-type multidrug transport system ATPase subunit
MVQPDEALLKVDLTKRGVHFKDLSFSVRTKSGRELRILNGITGWFEIGTSTALMGPSGSGNDFH